MRVAAVTLTVLFAALLIWLYGVKTTLIWAAAMTAFLLVLWLATAPLRARQRRAWLAMGLGPDGRPLPEVEEAEDDATETATSHAAAAATGDPAADVEAGDAVTATGDPAADVEAGGTAATRLDDSRSSTSDE